MSDFLIKPGELTVCPAVDACIVLFCEPVVRVMLLITNLTLVNTE